MQTKYLLIKGEKNLKKFCEKVAENDCVFTENIGHAGKWTFYNFYEKGPQDNNYQQYFMAFSDDLNGEYITPTDKCSQYHRYIREGKAKVWE